VLPHSVSPVRLPDTDVLRRHSVDKQTPQEIILHGQATVSQDEDGVTQDVETAVAVQYPAPDAAGAALGDIEIPALNKKAEGQWPVLRSPPLCQGGLLIGLGLTLEAVTVSPPFPA
jgi:hypothetical protein